MSKNPGDTLPSQPRLGPSWKSTSSGGKGFQPPSAEPDNSKNSNRNSFSLLDMDDDSPKPSDSSPRRYATRSDALRSSAASGGSFATNTRSTRMQGRSLSDLASRLPVPTERPVKSSSRGLDDSSESLRTSAVKDFDDKNVIRFTREKLLSMRPRVDSKRVAPEVLSSLEGSNLLSTEPQDPVCWDTFDADEIWSQVKDRQDRLSTKRTGTGRPKDDETENITNKSSSHGEPDRWQRGVALPPSERNRTSGNNRYVDAESPEELWDDPSSLTNTAPAADFSAFGGSLDDSPDSGDAFDLSAMAEAAKKFDDDFHKSDSLASLGDDSDNHDHKVNPTRPLASAGTTIRSGVGDDVNVFEDFDSPNDIDAEQVKSEEDQSPSSKLMQMIGVSSEPQTSIESSSDTAASGLFTSGFSSFISSNPWGTPVAAPTVVNGGLDLAAKLRDDELRRQQEEERKRVAMLAQQQARQAEMQKQQGGHAQVELILTERISNILENSWGRSDLITILQTIHSDDARVIPLLGTVDALRALIARHPNRFGLAKDPTFGAEIVVLVTNNAQWSQQQKAEEEIKRRQQLAEQQRLMAITEAEERSRTNAITNAPWYYADPQRNIQGPFSGEEMRQWLEAGYFKGDLPISQNKNGPFKTLLSLFPNISLAFKPTVVTGEIHMKNEAESRAQTAAKAAAERESKAKLEAAKSAEFQRSQVQQQNQSAQLKMMLGLGGNNKTEVDGANLNHQSQSESSENKPVPSIKVEPIKNVKSNTLKPQFQTTNSVEDTPPSTAVPVAQAWGGAATNLAVTRKSMSEIQKEEAIVAAAKHMAAGNKSVGGWANIAASGGTSAWSGAAAVKASPVIRTSSSSLSASMAQTNAKNQHTSAVVQRDMTTQSLNTQTVLKEFGADDQMTPALESWCKEQMKKLNGSEDLTLVAFCMTLSDPSEIKQYLTAYLGSSPQVSSFAQEFINRKSGKKQQDEWETTGKAKKNRSAKK